MLGISLTVLFSALAAFAVWSYYINPALRPLFESMATKLWKEVS